jgi:hypothetical protein
VAKEMFAKVGDNVLRDPRSQVAMAHRTQTLQDYQAEEQTNRPSHLVGIVLNSDGIPEAASQPNQGEINDRNSAHQEPGQYQTRHIRAHEWEESLEYQHRGQVV